MNKKQSIVSPTFYAYPFAFENDPCGVVVDKQPPNKQLHKNE